MKRSNLTNKSTVKEMCGVHFVYVAQYLDSGSYSKCWFTVLWIIYFVNIVEIIFIFFCAGGGNNSN